MRQSFIYLVFAGAVLVAASMTLGRSSAFGYESTPVPSDAAGRYKAAIKAAEARFQQSFGNAQSQFVRDVEAAGALLVPAAKPTPNPVEKPTRKTFTFPGLPVKVTGADAVVLIESTGSTGWSGLPLAARGAALFETRKSEPMDGVLEFSVTRDSLIGLAASWAYDGNASGGWQEDRKWKKDLTDAGWVEVGQMFHNLTDRHTLFVRQCQKGEAFGIRTRKYRRPYVFIPEVIDASLQAVAAPQPESNVVIEVLGAEQHVTEEFLPDADLTPGQLEGTICYDSPLNGVALIRVHRRETVYVAASWDYDGNTSGQWTEERWSKQKFLDEGWKEIGTVTIKHRGSNQKHILFARDCNKGERFRMRTRKYGAPYVFVSPPAK